MCIYLNLSFFPLGTGGTNGVIQAYSNLFPMEEDEEDSSYLMSHLSIGDHDDELDNDLTLETRGVKTVSFDHASVRSAVSRGGKAVHGASISRKKDGSIQCVLPYMIDYWHDRQPMRRASIQLHMLSGNSKMRDRISYRVSTNSMELLF